LSEETLALVEDRHFPDEFELAEDRLSRALNDLPLLQRRVLALLFIEQRTAPEIAAELGCSIGYVYKEKHRALKKIREVMEGDDCDN